MSNEAWKRNLPVPFFSQRENSYVWRQHYKNDAKDKQGNSLADQVIQNVAGISMAWQSCNITSLCMILQYFGITDDSPDDMMRRVFEIDFKQWAQEEKGCDKLEVNTNMREILTTVYGISTSHINIKAVDLSESKKSIAAGYPVWFSFGPLSKTKNGHIAVLRGFTPEGDVIINDPWGDVSDPYGYLTKENSSGYYYANVSNVMNSSGLGTGDNCIIKKKEFEKITFQTFHQSLIITLPKMWDFPVKTGLKESENAEQIQTAINNLFSRELWEKTTVTGKKTVAQGYPLCENGKFHDGIHIRGGENESLYPLGPGRLVAVRNAGESQKKNDDSFNFALVRHWIPSNKEKNSHCFYSCYMHIAPIAIRQRIYERFSFSTTDTKIIQNEARDWLDQIIDHILPKKAQVRIETTVTGNDEKSIPVYTKDSNNRIATLKDRAIIYLCPVNNELKKHIETLEEKENDAQLKKLYVRLNDIETPVLI